ncbi:O-antigen ligase family protein [Segetibacter aerophilus]|uniref:O-antigen ligase-related domain-containing protein n=1 Tax=Segetibacter aerophilus TaxID=670293 RepID=A0A512BGY9_9BACT|nr:O-antigen ligase family protein [Segetibacter aerophilus]GEO11238.1 hypothetical protein SAE01_37340 [Segetibacter aerophilus]
MQLGKYYFLVIVYFVGVMAGTLAHFFGADIQTILRLPFLNFRWIDFFIIVVVTAYIFKAFTKPANIDKTKGLLILCFILLLFEILQLIRSWGRTEDSFQIAGFICFLTIFIIIDLLTFDISKAEIIKFIERLAVLGAITVIVKNAYLLYSFINGNIIYVDSEIRVGLEVIGEKESVYTSILTSFVYAFSLFYIENSSKRYQKILFVTAILSIYLSLVYSFRRGDLFSTLLITIIYSLVFSKTIIKKIQQAFIVFSLLVTLYFIFGRALAQRGYDPIQKVVEIAQFSVDVDNPDWDKGRSIPRQYALTAWERSPFFGYGYDDLHNFGLPEDINGAHNFVITSLFIRGIVGTTVYLLILFMLYRNSILFWRQLRNFDSYENNIIRLLIVVSFFWLIPFWTQEAIWEKYSLSMQMMYLGLINNLANNTIVSPFNLGVNQYCKNE